LVACAALLGVLSGCQSGSALRNVPVTYVFENVRSDAQGGGRDEWTALRRILVENSATTPTIRPGQSRSLGSTRITSYRVELVAPSLRSLDAIQAGVEALQEGRSERERVRFSLVDLSVGYRSNAVAAGLRTSVSGIATQGYAIRLFTEPGRAPLRATAGRGGAWSVELDAPPGTGWVYGVSQDPAGRDRPAYFRVSTLTGVQEPVDQAEFERLFGPAGAGGGNARATPSPASTVERATGREEQELRRRREAEEARIRRQRESDERRPRGRD
jgi:hypothetical protein